MTAEQVRAETDRGIRATLAGLLARRPDDGPTPLPFRPETAAEVPVAAWRQLEQTCGELTLDRLFVIPAGAGFTRRRRPTPLRVLAFGSRAVGHWIDDGGEGRLECVPLEDVLAIDDRTVLLDGRLVVFGAHSQVVVQYNAAARSQLRESVLWLRRAIAGPAFPAREGFVWVSARGVDRPRSELPHKWTYLLSQRTDLRIDATGEEMVAVGDVAEIGRSRGPATGVALLGPRELVVAAEPSEWLDVSRYGVDLTVVPRSRLRDIGWREGQLIVRLLGETGPLAPTDPSAPPAQPQPRTIARPLDERLYQAMCRSFGDAIQQAEVPGTADRRRSNWFLIHR
jgi:hypothetical protein